MRLMFVARAVDGIAGGVERMIITLMNALAARGHEVDLFTWDSARAEAFYPLSPGIKWHRLDLGDPKAKASKRLLLDRAKSIRALVRRRRPEAIVCFQDGPFIAMRAYTVGLGIPVVAAERNAPTRFQHTSAVRRQKLIYQSLRLAARIAIQFESYRTLYPRFLHGRIVCIPNPVCRANFQATPNRPRLDGRFRLLSVGRLSHQKNYGVLIEAFAQLAPIFPDWDLVILGDGEDRARLESAIAAQKLQERVSLPGTRSSLTEWYSTAHAFCLPSRWEGFPNALAEALAHGLPAIGFAGCAGVSDLITHGRNGLVAEGNGNAESLARTLKTLLSDGTMRKAMGNEGPDSVKQFDPPRIVSLWESLLSSIAVP